MKTHFISNYNWTRKGDMDFVTHCGIRRKKHRKFINGSILASRVTCQKCQRFINSKIADLSIPVSIICIILFISIFFSCSAIDKIERPHDVLWDYTKALKTIEVHPKYVVLESFSNPARTYIYRTKDLHMGDTLILNDSLRIELRILKQKSLSSTGAGIVQITK